MHYALKESEVSLDEASNNLLWRYIVTVNNSGRILSLNTPTVDQLKNTLYQSTLNDS
jgi:predicted acetyltransferase